MTLTDDTNEAVRTLIKAASDPEITPQQADVCAMAATFNVDVREALLANPALPLLVLEYPNLARKLGLPRHDPNETVARILGSEFEATYHAISLREDGK